MTPFIETMPLQWVEFIVAGQGIALQKVALNKEMSDEMTTLSKALLYASWMLNKAGLLSVEDQKTLSEHAVLPSVNPRAHLIPGLVAEMVGTVYSTMNNLYEDEISNGMLVSDALGSTPLQ